MTKLNIIQAMCVNNECYKVGLKTTHVGILVHSTGANNPELRRYCDNELELGKNQYGNHWNASRPGGQQICAHGFVGYDKNRAVRACQCLPYTQNCWLSGSGSKGSANFDPHSRIQFEICEDGLNNKAYFDEAVMGVAAQWCAELCQQFGWNPLGKDKHGNFTILDHATGNQAGIASGHADISHWLKKFGLTMTDFRNEVKRRLDVMNGSGGSEPSNPTTPVVPSNPTTPYRVQIGPFSLKGHADIAVNYVKPTYPEVTLHEHGNMFYVKVGDFTQKVHAETAVNSLKKAYPEIKIVDYDSGVAAATTIPKKSVEEVASEIWNGKGGWGFDPARKEKLIAYGGVEFRNAVQKRLNEIASGK